MSKYQENIIHLAPKPKTPIIKPPMHRSIFNKSVKRELNLNKGCHETMGYAKVPLKRPSEFLKKQTAKVLRPFVENAYKKSTRKPVQCKSYLDQPLPNKRITKNFLKENVVDAVRLVPTLPKHRVQDSRYGHTMVLDKAGLEPTYMSKKNFARTPQYIKKLVKKTQIIKQAEIERKLAIKPPLRYVQDDERNYLLTGLKTNWDEMYKHFLLLPMITDTIQKINQKTKIEKKLSELEKDINTLERYPSLYVCDNA